ncbi:MAG: TRAP transporter fused permease subunit [Pseudomonadota bacterium]|nr:TRAP transporter fused permease subunit [Pseudomonadota bacterium]
MLDRLETVLRLVGRWAGLILSVGAIYASGPFPLMDQGLRLGGAIGLAVIVLLLTRPLAKQFKNISETMKLILWVVDLVVLVAFLATLVNFAQVYESFWDGVFILETPQLMVGLFGALVVLEATRRAFGSILPIICVIGLVYAHFGDLPGIFGHKGFTFEESITAIWFSFSGVFGRPTDIVSDIVLIFIIFGVTLEATGATAILLKMATAATSRIRGGAAHSAIVASAMFGTISGSAVGNVVGTGVFTIPLIKKQGFSNSFSGAVEASASSGGQFTPPIMAAVAFIMAELIGEPYLKIAAAAAIPALFYYFAMFASVYAEAVRLGIGTVTSPKLTGRDWLISLKFLVPVVTVVSVLFAGRSPAAAGWWAAVSAILAAVVVDLLVPDERDKLRGYGARAMNALFTGGGQCSQIMVAVGSIGTVIAVVALTGLAGNFAAMVASIAEGSLFFALTVAMLACLLLGMGLPTLPAYLFIVLFVGPIIGKLGVEALLVHLFVLYFGVLANVTPPVAIAAYAAAPIAGSNPMITGFQACKIAAVGFIIPYIFVYYPSITLVVQFEWTAFIWIMIRLPVAVWLLASALIGCDAHRIGIADRIIRAAAALAMLITIVELQIGALVVGLGILLVHRVRYHKRRGEPVAADTGE